MTTYQKLQEAVKNLEKVMDLAAEVDEGKTEFVPTLALGAEVVQARALQLIAEDFHDLVRGQGILRVQSR